jgi:hypothetical protein
MAKEVSPANNVVETAQERKRIPMSLPRLKLEVPEIPGYHLHWFADRPGRIAQALQAFYEFVDIGETSVSNTMLADEVSQTGNTDMGTRVSIVGGAGEGGTVERLYLMKIKEEYWREDQKALEEKNKSVVDQIFRGVAQPGTPGDGTHRYVEVGQRQRI